MLASLGAGVPLVLIPRGTPSQLRMAQACESAGVGRSCADEFGIEVAVSNVLLNPATAARAKYAAAISPRCHRDPNWFQKSKHWSVLNPNHLAGYVLNEGRLEPSFGSPIQRLATIPTAPLGGTR